MFSNAALHGMDDPTEVIKGVHRALRPGGRFVGELGGKGNVQAIVAALREALRGRGIDPAPFNPWYFPSQEEDGDLLRQCGFSVDELSIFSRPTPLAEDLSGWLKIFARSFLAALQADEQGAFLAEVREKLMPGLCTREGRWVADYVRLRFYAIRS